MKPVSLLAGLLTVFLTVGYLASAKERPGRYRKHAKKSTIEAWESHFEKKRELVPELAPLPDAPPVGVDFSGDYRFGRYDYDLHIEQSGTRVAFRSARDSRRSMTRSW